MLVHTHVHAQPSGHTWPLDNIYKDTERETFSPPASTLSPAANETENCSAVLHITDRNTDEVKHMHFIHSLMVYNLFTMTSFLVFTIYCFKYSNAFPDSPAPV